MAKDKKISNFAASVRARLLNLAKRENREFEAVLLQYFQERYLYRLSRSNYRNRFILKGALLFLIFDISRYRPTKDMDFLSMLPASESDLEALSDTIADVVNIPTFKNRGTSLEDRVGILDPKFKMSKDKQDQWSAFLVRNHLHLFEQFPDVIDRLHIFIEAVCRVPTKTTENATWEPNKWRWNTT